jgi:host factor-I protein
MMVSERIINVQDAFLNYVRKNKVPVTMFLLNGVKLTGIVSCFDQSVVVLKRETYTQLVYKHAISTFSPHGPIGIFDWNTPVQQQQRSQLATSDEKTDEDLENFTIGEEDMFL